MGGNDRPCITDADQRYRRTITDGGEASHVRIDRRHEKVDDPVQEVMTSGKLPLRP